MFTLGTNDIPSKRQKDKNRRAIKFSAAFPDKILIVRYRNRNVRVCDRTPTAL